MGKDKYIKNSKKNLIKKYTIAILVSIALFALFVLICNLSAKTKTFKLSETASVDYIVCLKDNEFYNEKFLVADKQYISNLIESIVANYSYNMDTSGKENFECTYSVNAILDIYDTGTKKSLYTYTQNLLPENKILSSDGKVLINEKLTIDYPYFNRVANRFIDTYALSGANASVLKVKLLVKTKYSEESVVALDIPLTKHTFDITQSNQLASTQPVSESTKSSATVMEKISLIGIVLSVCTTAIYSYKLIRKLLDSRTEEQKYRSSVKKILGNYGEYINQTSDFQFKLDEYEIVRVNTFLDLLKIKEDLSRPILMIENKEKTNVVFAITDNSKFIYMFGLNMHQRRLAAKNEQTETKV